MRMRVSSVCGGIAAGMLICLGGLGAAAAQDEPQGDQTQMIEQLGEDSGEAGSPGRAGQLSDAEGSVSLEPAGTTTWTSAVINRPLTLGDKLWADQDSRAEIDIGDAVIRLGSTTGFSFLNLDDQTAQMQVTAGTVIVRVRSLASGEHDEIDTPNLAVTLEQPGTYRVDVSDSGDATIVEVADGAALVTGGGQSYPVAAQQSVTFTGTGALAADYATLGAPDPLDQWSLQRDQQEQQQAAVAQDYVPPDTVGADDLGSYGTWEDTPDWGYAWFPTVAIGWAPYSLGNWAWVSPWGWTWVDAEPWGFAPFHYGRWGYWGHRWCWVPGPRGVRPTYAPALVAWVGVRRGAQVSAGGRVGWFPLGPGDAYGGRTNNVRYVNSQIPGATTVVARNVFVSAQPVGPHRVALPRESMAGLQPTTSGPGIAPLRQSVLGVNAGSVVRTPPRALVDRPVVARLAPPRAPVSFAREQAAVRANGGQPLSVTQLSQMRPYTPAAPVRLASPTGNRRAAINPSMSDRERTLQQPSLPPERAQQRLAPPPLRAVQQPQRPPAPALRSDRPPWAQGQSPREVPQQRFAPQQARPSAAPAARPPEVRPQQQRPPLNERADAEPESFGGGYAPQWRAPPPMYRPQENTFRYQAPAQAARTPYRPPVSPPPMYRPLPSGGGAARAAPPPRGSPRPAGAPRRGGR